MSKIIQCLCFSLASLFAGQLKSQLYIPDKQLMLKGAYGIETAMREVYSTYYLYNTANLLDISRNKWKAYAKRKIHIAFPDYFTVDTSFISFCRTERIKELILKQYSKQLLRNYDFKNKKLTTVNTHFLSAYDYKQGTKYDTVSVKVVTAFDSIPFKEYPPHAFNMINSPFKIHTSKEREQLSAYFDKIIFYSSGRPRYFVKGSETEATADKKSKKNGARDATPKGLYTTFEVGDNEVIKNFHDSSAIQNDLSSKTVYKYDDKGQITQVIEYEPSGYEIVQYIPYERPANRIKKECLLIYTDTTLTEMSLYEDKKEKRTLTYKLSLRYSDQEVQVEEFDIENNFSVYYTYNLQQKLIKTAYLDQVKTIEYTPFGKIKRMCYETLKAQSIVQDMKIEFEYSDTLLMRIVNTVGEKYKMNPETPLIDDEKYPLKETMLADNMFVEWEFAYDERKRLTSFRHNLLRGKEAYRFSVRFGRFTYDTHGLPVLDDLKVFYN